MSSIAKKRRVSDQTHTEFPILQRTLSRLKASFATHVSAAAGRNDYRKALAQVYRLGMRWCRKGIEGQQRSRLQAVTGIPMRSDVAIFSNILTALGVGRTRQQKSRWAQSMAIARSHGVKEDEFVSFLATHHGAAGVVSPKRGSNTPKPTIVATAPPGSRSLESEEDDGEDDDWDNESSEMTKKQQPGDW